MEEDIAGMAVIGQDEAVALGHVEPLDRAGNLDKIGGIAAIVPRQARPVGRASPRQRGLVPHKNAPFPSTATTDSYIQDNTLHSDLCKSRHAFFPRSLGTIAIAGIVIDSDSHRH